MAQTRTVFKTGVSAAIYTNTQKLVKGDTVRDKFLVMADSVIFEERANAAGGFLAIDAAAVNVNIAFIKSATPAGNFLRDDGTWASVASLPTQTGNGGKFLTTNGSAASWADPLPAQTGNSGKFLTTNGSALSWISISPGGADETIQFNSSGVFGGNSRFVWNNANNHLKTDGSALFGLPVSNSPTAFVDIAAAIPTRASLRIRPAASAPTTLNDGDIWYTGGVLWIRIGANTRRFTVTV